MFGHISKRGALKGTFFTKPLRRFVDHLLALLRLGPRVYYVSYGFKHAAPRGSRRYPFPSTYDVAKLLPPGKVGVVYIISPQLNQPPKMVRTLFRSDIGR